MIKKVVRIKNLEDKNLILDDLKYWLSKSPKERIPAIDVPLMPCFILYFWKTRERQRKEGENSRGTRRE